jgi:hypothetical protein
MIFLFRDDPKFLEFYEFEEILTFELEKMIRHKKGKRRSTD